MNILSDKQEDRSNIPHGLKCCTAMMSNVTFLDAYLEDQIYLHELGADAV